MTMDPHFNSQPQDSTSKTKVTTQQKKVKKSSLLDLACNRFPDVQRETLFSWILCGDLIINQQICKDPKSLWPLDGIIEKKLPSFVSRGGEKLLPVLKELMIHFPKLNPKDQWILDAGSSTGGFIQVLLMLGAQGVFGVDVGTNQLDYSLRTNPKVKSMEKTNIQAVQLTDLDPIPAFATADLSFRALGPVIPHILSLTSTKTGLFLLKPQFELSFAGVKPPESFTGICSDELGQQVLQKVISTLVTQGLIINHVEPAPIRGSQGNQEFFLYITSR
jgi:23S rRNA (cytidine1920-2'-O)/16S rRNA (cytidine1409-2'-O)-methyltransferase